MIRLIVSGVVNAGKEMQVSLPNYSNPIAVFYPTKSHFYTILQVLQTEHKQSEKSEGLSTPKATMVKYNFNEEEI